MSIIKTLQDYLCTYSQMDMQKVAVEETEQGRVVRVIGSVLTDLTDKRIGSYALTPSGNGKIVTDILGNKTLENNYVFYAKEAAADEVNRQDNYDFLEDFSDWLDEQNDAGNLPELPGRYEAESIEVANIMLFDINEDGTGLYQVQIKLIITKKKGA